jgi:hypothetical protein
MSDISIQLDLNGGFRGRNITPDGLRRLPGLMVKELNSTMKLTAQYVLGYLRHKFEAMYREKPRNQNYLNADPRLLKQRLAAAYISEVKRNKDEIIVDMFDYRFAEAVTRNEGWRTGSVGWFKFFADAHAGRAHGSTRFGFISHRLAMDLAEKCADKYIHDEGKKLEWLGDMDRAFKGKHDDPDDDKNGIMVDLDKPLFFRFPDFGKAGKFTHRHHGFHSWPALPETQRWMADREGQVIKDIVAAMNRAAEQVMT